MKLFLDDIRGIQLIYSTFNPEEWVVVRNYNEFVNYIKYNDMPEFISFDHDLADVHFIDANPDDYDKVSKQINEKTGYDCAKWLIDYCLDNNLSLPDYEVHSFNPVGKERIRGLLDEFKKFNEK